MPKLFVSYDRGSGAIVKRLAEDLRSLGHAVWLDHELTGGHPWWDHILQEVRECQIFVAVLSEGALESVACTREREYADALGKPVVPVLVSDGVSTNLLPPPLDNLHYVDYRQPDAKATLADLNRAMNEAPLPDGLPDPLPPPPETPVSYLGGLARQVGSTSELSYHEQAAILVDLKKAFSDAATRDDARALLGRLRERPDLFAKIAGEIDELLGEPESSSDFARLITILPVATSVVVALLAGGSAPWWLDELFGPDSPPARTVDTVAVAARDFSIPLPFRVSDLFGRFKVYVRDGGRLETFVEVTKPQEPRRGSIIAADTAQLFGAPDGYEVCETDLPIDAALANRPVDPIDYFLGLKTHCPEDRGCSFNFPHPDRVFLTLHDFNVVIAPEGACP